MSNTTSMLSDLGLEYKHLGEVSSTNDFLRSYVPQAPVTLAVADFQTRGRGQVGSTWVSNRGENLLFSILLCPTALRAADSFVLSQAMALAIKQALDCHISGVLVKWPNDIYCHNRKICGTLIENTLAGPHVARSIIGSGINVNQTSFPSGLAVPPTSMHLELGHLFPIEELLHDIVLHFLPFHTQIQQGDYESIRQLYHESLYMRECPGTFIDANGSFVGTISRVAPTGHLIIIDQTGQERSYTFKEVKIENRNILQ